MFRKSTIKLLFLFFTFYILHFTFYISPAYAQVPSLETTSVYEVSDTDSKEGDILVATDKGLVRGNKSFDNKMFGVIAVNPIIVYRNTKVNNGHPVIRSGTGTVNVTPLNGPIKF